MLLLHKFNNILLVSQLCRLSFDLCCSLISTKPAKGGAYKIDLNIWWMNKLRGGCFIGHDTSILLYKYTWIYKYSLSYGETRLLLVLPSRVNICIYSRKLYNKAYINYKRMAQYFVTVSRSTGGQTFSFIFFFQGQVIYCPASQEWQWRHVLFTKLLGTYY